MLWCGCEIPVRCWKRCVWVGGWSPGPPGPHVPDLLCPHLQVLLCTRLPLLNLLCYSLLLSLFPTWATTMLHMVQQSHLLPPTVPLKAVHTLLLRALSPSSCLPLSVWLRGFQALSPCARVSFPPIQGPPHRVASL